MTEGGAVQLFFDGRSARPQRAEVWLTAAALVLRPEDGTERRWLLDELRSLPDQAERGTLVVTATGEPLARLILRDAALCRALRASARHLRRRPPVRGLGRLAGWAVAAVASVLAIVFVLVPVMADQLAGYMPPAGEKALGDATLEQIRSALSDNDFLPMRFCSDTEGVVALDRMSARLTEGLALPYPVEVHVLDGKVINAFALPGGHVVFFRGLLDAAETPEELAAVFAHELGHVQRRDPTRSALRSAGSIGIVGLLFGDFAGGTVVLFLTNRLIEAQYSQEAEGAADRFAHARMIAAGIRPDALATIFGRIRDEYGETEGFLKHFESHPGLGNRIEAARRAAEGMEGAPVELLTAADWAALKAICGR